MSIKIGASLYLGLDDYKIEDNLKYLDTLKECNIEYVFISAHMEEANANFDNEFKKVIEKAKKLGIKLIVDVNKKRLEELELKGETEGVFCFRLDYGFTKEELIGLQDKSYLIELNASMLKEEIVNYLVDNGINKERIRISHNFFPKPYTGLSYEDVKKKNDYFHSLGFKVSIYIPSNKNRRPPLYLGLPTIEDQRNEDLIAILTESKLVGADEVLFGDAIIDKEELTEAINYDDEGNKDLLLIPIKLVDGVDELMINQLNKRHANRLDNSPYMIRSSVREKEIKELNCVKRHKGDVTIDNINMKRYSGEVGIALRDMPQDDGVNVVGKCLCNDYLLDNVKPGQRFKFVIRK